jgi:hypothetical protein
MTPSPSKLELVRESRMDMAVHMDAGTPLSDEVAARWRERRPRSAGVADAGENRFSLGWERRPHEPFASYGDCWPALAEDLVALQQVFVVTGAGTGAVGPIFSACELSYVNPVTFEEHGQRHGRLERLLVRWLLPEPGDGWLPAPDHLVTCATFPMTQTADGAPGQLSVQMRSMPGETPEPVFGMTLSANCAVHSARLDALEAAFDVAFEWIVRGYATLGEPLDTVP